MGVSIFGWGIIVDFLELSLGILRVLVRPCKYDGVGGIGYESGGGRFDLDWAYGRQ